MGGQALRTRLLAAMLGTVVLAGCGSTPSPLPVASPTPRPSATVAPTINPSPAAPSLASSPAPPSGLTTPVPPGADVPWTAIQWRKVASTDPLRLVRSILRWRGGFIAVGSDGSLTPVWTSRDGASWEPVSFNTATTFWPGLLVVGMAEVPGGLVALTLLAGTWECAVACPTYSPSLPLMAWTSPDGRSWTPNTGPDLGSVARWQTAPLLAAGPSGLVAASPTVPSHLATSIDGIHWRTVSGAALPPGFRIRDIAGTGDRVTAVGALPVDPDHDRAAALQSVDGITWTGPYPLDVPTASTFILASTGPSWGATALVAARSGLVAVGAVLATPGTTLWWQSADGRAWRPLTSFPPLGPTTCSGEGCGSGPNGALLGDGHRMVALRGGADASAWTSSDGLTWRRLPVTGDLPAGQAAQAVLLPDGVLLSDGTTTWFGEAQAR